MMRTFTYDGTSSKSMGIIVSGNNTYGGAVRDVETVSIPGRNGDIVIDHGRYKNVTIVYSCMTKTLSAAYEAREWLAMHMDRYYKLTDTYASGEYRMARVSEAFDPTIDRRYGTAFFEIHFDCDPRRFLTDYSTGYTVPANGSTQIRNTTRNTAYPLIQFDAPGNIVIAGRGITVSGSYKIAVDCDEMYAYYDGVTGRVNYNGNLTLDNGAWPVLAPGYSKIVNNTAKAITVYPRYWRL